MQSFLCRLLHTEVNHGGSLASLSQPFSHLVLFADGTLVAFLRETQIQSTASRKIYRGYVQREIRQLGIFSCGRVT
jgi:hypothetical protein